MLGGDPASPPKNGGTGRPQFSAHVRCDQTAALTKMPLGKEVGVGPGDFVLDGDPATPKNEAQPPILSHVYCGQTVADVSYF